LVLLVAAAMLLITSMIGLLIKPDILQSLGIVPPDPMPSGVNVVVTGFGMEQQDGTIVSDPDADSVSDSIFASLKQFPIINHLRGRNDIGVGTILAKDLKEREAQAAVIAKRLRATIVIYGIVRDKGAILAFEPRFYVSPEFAAAQPELSGADSSGKPVELLKG
jgi:hypothetical protein